MPVGLRQRANHVGPRGCKLIVYVPAGSDGVAAAFRSQATHLHGYDVTIRVCVEVLCMRLVAAGALGVNGLTEVVFECRTGRSS